MVAAAGAERSCKTQEAACVALPGFRRRREAAGDELDPLEDDGAGFLQDIGQLLEDPTEGWAPEELFPEKRIVVFHILPEQRVPQLVHLERGVNTSDN